MRTPPRAAVEPPEEARMRWTVAALLAAGAAALAATGQTGGAGVAAGLGALFALVSLVVRRPRRMRDIVLEIDSDRVAPGGSVTARVRPARGARGEGPVEVRLVCSWFERDGEHARRGVAWSDTRIATARVTPAGVTFAIPVVPPGPPPDVDPARASMAWTVAARRLERRATVWRRLEVTGGRLAPAARP